MKKKRAVDCIVLDHNSIRRPLGVVGY